MIKPTFYKYILLFFFTASAQMAIAQCSSQLNSQAMDLLNGMSGEPPVSFAVIGDTELSESFLDILEDLKTRFDAGEIDFIVNVGDLFPSYSFNEEVFIDYHEIVSTFMVENGIPYFTVPGNHDLECNACDDYYQNCIGDVDWNFEFGGACFLGVNNVQQENGYVAPTWQAEIDNYAVADETIQNVQDFLESNDCDQVFSFTHVPINWTYGCDFPGYMEYYSMLVGNGLTANYAGHIHGYHGALNELTGVYDIGSGFGSDHLTNQFGTRPPTLYQSSPGYTITSIDGNNQVNLDLIVQDGTPPNTSYKHLTDYDLDITDPSANTNDSYNTPLYNDDVKPIINIVEDKGQCYACIDNLTGIYDDLGISIGGLAPGDPTDLDNGQLCYLMKGFACDSEIVVEYNSCPNSSNAPSISLDANDVQGFMENYVLDIDNCERCMTIQLTENVSIGTSANQGSFPISQETLFNNKVRICWDELALTSLTLDLTLDLCACSVTEELFIPLPICEITENCCPKGSVWNGADCYYQIQVPEGYDAYIWRNGFYTHYGPDGPGDCPPGANDNGAGCDYGINIPDGYDPFIWQDGFYVHENCDVEPEKCCPPGSTWDGAHCDFKIRIPEGFTGFISNDNGLYANPNVDGQCPPGTTRDAIGCSYGVSITPGLNGFIWNNGFYAHENCDLDLCCPPETEYNGNTCVHKNKWPGANGFVALSGQVLLFPDKNGNCPDNSWYNQQSVYCQTDVYLPEGFAGELIDGVLHIEHNCESCCPNGFTFDGTSCCYTITLDSEHIGIQEDQFIIAKDCNTYGETNNCCPPGFTRKGSLCYSNQSSDSEVITIQEETIKICRTAENCLGGDIMPAGPRSQESTAVSESTSVKVFPNPFTSSINLSIKSEDAKLVSLQILSTTGQLIFNQKRADHSNAEIQINPILDSGIYFLHAQFENSSEVIKIIKI